MLQPVHRWLWRDPARRAHKLLRFSETEIDGGRDILRAAEVTSDPLLRRLYLVHAADESRHGQLFRKHAAMLLSECGDKADFEVTAPLAMDHGLDDLRVDEETDETLLAFLHVAEKDAAARFAIYHEAVEGDRPTQAVFEQILHDEKFHMNYTLTQLVRVSPQSHRRRLWYARLSRIWKAYLRVAAAIGSAMGTVLLTIQYFVLIPAFAFFAKRAARREKRGWNPIPSEHNGSLTSQY